MYYCTPLSKHPFLTHFLCLPCFSLLGIPQTHWLAGSWMPSVMLLSLLVRTSLNFSSPALTRTDFTCVAIHKDCQYKDISFLLEHLFICDYFHVFRWCVEGIKVIECKEDRR